MKVLIVGAGEIGAQIARYLVEEKQSVVVIEREAAKCRELASHIDASIIEGDGTDPTVLVRAGVADAELILSVTDNDIANILACNIASVYAPDAIRLARIRNKAYCDDERILTKNGIDIALNPEQLVVEKIANLLSYRQCIDYVEFEEGRISVIAYAMTEGTPLLGKRLKEIRQRYAEPDFLITMIIRGGKATIPDGETEILLGDRVYFLTRKADVPGIQRILDVPTDPLTHVFIHGGDYLARSIAKRLETRKGLSVKIAHPDAAKCEIMATELEHALVLNGDPADEELLTDEYVDGNTVFIAADRDEERNLLSAVLAKGRSQRSRVLGVTSRSTYVPILTAIGLDVVLCPLNIAVSNILQYLRKGVVVQMGALETKEATAIEFIASERLHGKPIHKLGLPQNVLIGALLREKEGDPQGEVIIPTGLTKIRPYDRLIVFTPRSHYKHLDRHFALRGGR